MRRFKTWFADGVLSRMFKNAGLLLTGRATTMLLGLGVLSIAAHGLGAQRFGVVTLVVTYVQTIAAITTFQSWQAVIRFGALAQERKDQRQLQGLVRFCTLLDIAGVVVATAIAYLAVPWIGPRLGWDASVTAAARPYCLITVFSVTATPIGLLRLYDRFDLLSIQSVIGPAIRLVGVALAAFFHRGPAAYLVVWFAAGLCSGSVLVAMGWREFRRHGGLEGFSMAPGAWAGSSEGHPGLWRFSLISNLHYTVQTVSTLLTTLLVGAAAGPAPAGIFKIARDVATVLTKPAELLDYAIYPEFARLGSRAEWRAFPRLILRSGAMVGFTGIVLMLLVAMVGHRMLGVAFGHDFVAAQMPLMLLLGAATLALLGFPLEPALYAMGRPGIPLQINTAVIAVYVPGLFFLTRAYGPLGAAGATLLSSALILIAMAIVTAAHLGRVLGVNAQSRQAPNATRTAAPAAARADPIPSPRSLGRFHHSRREREGRSPCSRR
jgi:O-antigen/teichoic acid export membrane protein